MPNYKLNYIHIDDQNVKTFGILHLTESVATDIGKVKQRVTSGSNSATLFSIGTGELSPDLRLNLMMIDSEFPKILEAVIAHTQHQVKLTSLDVCKQLNVADPLNFGHDYEQTIYQHKWKQFLLALGSGFTEHEVWTGKFNGIEHHAIFKQSDKGLIPDFFYPAPFAEYLFFNTVVLWSEAGFEIQLF